MRARARIPGIVTVAVTLSGLVVVLAGGPFIMLWLAAAASSALLIGRWNPIGFALSATTVGFLAVELAVLQLSPLIGAGLFATEATVWTVVGTAAGIASALVPPRPRNWSRSDWRIIAAACTGSFVVLVLLVLAQFLPGMVHFAWAMFDDAVRDLLAARQIVRDQGIVSAVGQPTPLPFGLVAANLIPSRASIPLSGLLPFDVARLAQVWLVVIAGGCLLLGAIGARLLRRVRAVVALPAVLLLSLAGLGWWVAGIQLQGGFLNAGFAIAVLLASWLAFLEGERRPFRSAIVLTAAAIVMLAVWSPLVLCVVALLIVEYVKAFRSRRTLGETATLAAGLGLLGLYAAALTLPSAVSQSTALGNEGGFPEISTPVLLGLVIVVTALLVVDTRRSGNGYLAAGAGALAGGSLLGVAYIVYQRRDNPDPWGYYPEKFTWLALLLMIVVAISLLSAQLIQRPLPVGDRAMRLGVVVGTAVVLVLGSLGGADHLSPAIGVLRGSLWGISDRQADLVFAEVRSQAQPKLVGDGNPEKIWVYLYTQSVTDAEKRGLLR